MSPAFLLIMKCAQGTKVKKTAPKLNAIAQTIEQTPTKYRYIDKSTLHLFEITINPKNKSTNPWSVKGHISYFCNILIK